jgi:LysM repeat protein
MTHTVKSGETLAKIAKANGITLDQLLEANPTFKANPNRVRVGDVLNIPDGQPASSPTPTPAPEQPAVSTPTQPRPTGTFVLGKLSERFETGGRGPGTVSTGKGDAGGASYGSYQMTSKPRGGTVKTFITSKGFPFASNFADLLPGTAPFTGAWKKCASAQKDEFQSCQHDFIKRTHFDPLVAKILREDKLNILTRSHAVQDVVWSTAVQHGPDNNLIHKAIATIKLPQSDPGYDKAFIIAVYAERGRKNAKGALVHFGRNSAAVQKGVANRFKQEQKDALAMLASES